MLPSQYFRRQGWISIESDEPNLATIADAIGDDRLLWASDYPHPDATYPGMVDELFEAKDLSDVQLRKIACDNPAALFGLDLSTR